MPRVGKQLSLHSLRAFWGNGKNYLRAFWAAICLSDYRNIYPGKKREKIKAIKDSVMKMAEEIRTIKQL